MADPCATHPERASSGGCVRCSRRVCPLCVVDVDGTLYCSILCFTEQTLETKRKTLRDKSGAPGADPLAGLDLGGPDPASDLSEPSIVLPASQASPTEDSSILLSAAAEQDRSETSILDMSGVKRTEDGAFDESSVLPMESVQRDPTSILGMQPVAKAEGSTDLPSWMDEKPEVALPQDESMLDLGVMPRSSSGASTGPKCLHLRATSR